MALPHSYMGRILLKRGSSAEKVHGECFSKAEPAIGTAADERRSMLLAMRQKNRRMLAEKYIFENPVKSRENLPSPYPEMEKEYRIESISSQPDVLHEYAAPRCKCTRWNVRQLVKKLRDGDRDGKRAAAEELAMITSDPQVYLMETSIAALKALAMESLAHGSGEARQALESIGFAMDKIPRIEILALIASRPRLWFSKNLRDGLRMLSECLESGF